MYRSRVEGLGCRASQILPHTQRWALPSDPISFRTHHVLSHNDMKITALGSLVSSCLCRLLQAHLWNMRDWKQDVHVHSLLMAMVSKLPLHREPGRPVYSHSPPVSSYGPTWGTHPTWPLKMPQIAGHVQHHFPPKWHLASVQTKSQKEIISPLSWIPPLKSRKIKANWVMVIDLRQGDLIILFVTENIQPSDASKLILWNCLWPLIPPVSLQEGPHSCFLLSTWCAETAQYSRNTPRTSLGI